MAETMTLEELQQIERRVQLEGDRDPEGVTLADGRTLAEVRRGQAGRAIRDREGAREFDRRSAEANRAARQPVAVTVTEDGVVGTSFVAPESEAVLTDEEEIKRRAEEADRRDLARAEAGVLNPAGTVSTASAEDDLEDQPRITDPKKPGTVTPTPVPVTEPTEPVEPAPTPGQQPSPEQPPSGIASVEAASPSPAESPARTPRRKSADTP